MENAASEGSDDREKRAPPPGGESGREDENHTLSEPGTDPGPEFPEMEIGDVVQVIRDLQDRLDYAYSIREALEADIEAANAGIASLRGENDGLRERIEFLEAREKLAVQLESELEFLHDEKSSSVRAIHALESSVSELTGQKKALEKDLSVTRAALSDVKTKAVELQMKVVELQDQAAIMGDLSGILAETKTELAQATDRVRHLELELDASVIAKESSERDLERKKKALLELRRETDDLKSSQETLEKEKRTLRSKLLTSEYENRRLKDQQVNLDRKLSDAIKDKGNFRGKLNDARQTLIEVQSALESTKKKFKGRWATGPSSK
jgi:chromosome segregation ATPase